MQIDSWYGFNSFVIMSRMELVRWRHKCVAMLHLRHTDSFILCGLQVSISLVATICLKIFTFEFLEITSYSNLLRWKVNILHQHALLPDTSDQTAYVVLCINQFQNMSNISTFGSIFANRYISHGDSVNVTQADRTRTAV